MLVCAYWYLNLTDIAKSVMLAGGEKLGLEVGIKPKPSSLPLPPSHTHMHVHITTSKTLHTHALYTFLIQV